FCLLLRGANFVLFWFKFFEFLFEFFLFFSRVLKKKCHLVLGFIFFRIWSNLFSKSQKKEERSMLSNRERVQALEDSLKTVGESQHITNENMGRIELMVHDLAGKLERMTHRPRRSREARSTTVSSSVGTEHKNDRRSQASHHTKLYHITGNTKTNNLTKFQLKIHSEAFLNNKAKYCVKIR
ncbi:Unknown protein, partial [Striga hermonthica]